MYSHVVLVVVKSRKIMKKVLRATVIVEQEMELKVNGVRTEIMRYNGDILQTDVRIRESELN